jgi:hypothetical protein
LLRNLGEAVQALGDRHGAAARRAAQHVRSYLTASYVPPPILPMPSTPIPTAAELVNAASRLRPQARGVEEDRDQRWHVDA